VTSVSFAGIVPFTPFIWDEDMSVGAGKLETIYYNSIGPNYFRTMRIPIFSGREFAWTDTPSTGPKIILNQAAVKLLFPITTPSASLSANTKGIPQCNTKWWGWLAMPNMKDLRSPAPPTAYVPMTQDGGDQFPSYVAVVRTNAVGRSTR
jgi:hypothetical protein